MRDPEHPRQRAESLIRQGNLEEATAILEPETVDDGTGVSDALLGLVRFRQGNYTAARDHIERAIGKAGNEPAEDWHALFEAAESNAESEIDEFVPDFELFEREPLLKLANPIPCDLPAPPSGPPPRGPIHRLATRTGNALGRIATALFEGATSLWGWLAGINRGGIWTTWYRRRVTLAILTLAHMRNCLNRRNLKNTYPAGYLTGFARPSESGNPPESVSHFRTADGSWNNLDNPLEGAAGTRFLRNVENSAIRPETEKDTLLIPNPREISLKLLSRTNGEMKEVPFLNLLAASWIQFQNHDWVNHGEVLPDALIEIPLPDHDPARKTFLQDRMFVGRTQPDPTRMDGKETTPITFINEVTHWWDGSQIYGSDWDTLKRLRSGRRGKLRIAGDGRLPLDRKGVEETGFVRNWWVGLSLLHTLFVREHNSICDHLRLYHPRWDDDRLFNVARLINAAVMAKIHTIEWTPAILPNPALDQALNANWYGILTNLFKVGKHRRTLAEINLANPELGGVVANPTNTHGQPYGLTEEFVEVYRLHSLLPEELLIRKIGSQSEEPESIPLPRTRQAGSAKLTDRIPMANLFFSFGNQQPGQLVLNNYPAFMQHLSIPGNPLFDLGAVDILRARERGVPRYNEFRRQLGLNPIRRFEDLTSDAKQLDTLKEVYPDGVETLDLMIGTLAEGPEARPTGFGFGETMFQIFILNATRRLQADRFYTDSYNEETYTREGLEWVDNTDLKTVLLRHYPALADTGLANVKNAFEPWDTEETLDPDRHPLRAHDPELKHDPWTGDACRDR